MSKTIIDHCYNNYKRSSKNYYSDTWRATAKQNIDFFKTKNIKKLLINSDLRGLVAIDNYPCCEYLNKSNSKILNNFQEKEYFEIYKKIKHLNYYFSPSYIINYRHYLNIRNKIKKDFNILLIGDGVGMLSSMIAKSIKCRIFLCDLPETLIFQEYFLRKNLPKTKIQFIANANDEIDYQNRIILINADQLKRLKIKLNLIINVDSFCEMDKSSVKKYFNYAKKNLVSGGIFYYCNTIGHSKLGYRNPSEYPLDNSFSLEKLDILYPSHRDTFCKYLTVTAKRNDVYEKKTENKNIKLKKSVLKKFFFETEKIIEKKSVLKIKKNTIKLINKISNPNNALKCGDKRQFLKLFKQNINKKNIYNMNIFYHFTFVRMMKYLNVKNKIEIEKLFNFIEEGNKQFSENTSIIKIASLARFFDIKYYYKIFNLIPENFFEIVFLKFFLYERIDLLKQKKLLKKLLEFKKNHFFDYLKLYYCSCKIRDDKISKFTLYKIKNNINHKDYAIYFLKLLFTLGQFQLFYKLLKTYKKKFVISNKEITAILLSTNFSNRKTREYFKKFFSNKSGLYYKNNTSIDNLTLCFKLGKLKEEKFINIILHKYNDYYSIGHVLKNTLHILSTKSLKFLCKNSLMMRSNSQNINFISEIYFYNFLYKESFKALNTIKNLDHFGIFAALKKYLSKFAIKNDKEKIQNLTSSDFFKVIHNGRTVILPFLCSGNNAVLINNN
tara:strand:+ start:584 stop:2752 length:2169 start_codon:yes stop_codon:yes gene_type:complete